MHRLPVAAVSVPAPEGGTVYPPPLDKVVAGRRKRKLGEFFGLSNFGVNLTTLQPGAASALLHHHSRQDELVYVLSGHPTLVLGEREYVLQAGDCFGQAAGSGIGSQLVNRGDTEAVFLEVGDRTVGDQVEYPQDDLKAEQLANGAWLITHKDGTPYAE